MSSRQKRRAAKASIITAFWDTSGIVPICCYQPQTGKARQIARSYARQVVWWGTSVEVVSSFNRLIREGHLTGQEAREALLRLDHLRRRWSEIQPAEEVREKAERLLGNHQLRAADALQLAAALVWCVDRPRARHFIGADGLLSNAAEAEGFTVIRLF